MSGESVNGLLLNKFFFLMDNCLHSTKVFFAPIFLLTMWKNLNLRYLKILELKIKLNFL